VAAAFVTSGGDGGEVIATAIELAEGAASELATDLLATKFGALVGSVDNGPDPFASVLAEFCFLCALAELENVRARETPNEIAERLVRAVLDLKPAAAPSANESGARRLLNRLRGAVKSALSNAPSRSLSVFIRATGTSAPWREVPVYDLLTRCGVRTKTGIQFSAAHCDATVFGWCEASEEQAGRRGLVVIVPSPMPDGPRGAAADLAREAHVKAVVRSEMRAGSSTRSTVAVESSVTPVAPNEYRSVLYGQCTQCECEEYVRPKEGARCEACDCAAMKHTKLK
jgi:hypothetical protein